MLARGWLAYPVTLVACATTAEERLQRDAAGRYDGFSRMIAIPQCRFRRLNFPEIADAKFLAKIFSLIYTTALRRLPSPFD